MSKSQRATISVWEDDPASGGQLVKVPMPTTPKSGLSFVIEDAIPVPPALYPRGDERFSYWAAVEGLTRSIGFWNRILRSWKIEQKWQNRSKKIKVRIRSLDDLNAFFDYKDCIEFGHSKQNGTTIWLSDSPQIVAHVVGHAVLH